MNKDTVYPHVIIYRNMLKNTDKIVNALKRSKSLDDKTEINHAFKQWKPWPPMGNMMILNMPDDDFIPDNYEIQEELDLLNDIYNNYRTVLLDYIQDWKVSDIWKPYISHWDIDKKNWEQSGVSFLRYDPSEDQSKLAMEYHTDTHEFSAESRGSKFVITVTMYLNDDYDGGEISFLDEDNKQVTTYKPKAGDITVFPSCEPFYHGILPVKNNERFLLRMFLLWNYEGSEEWLLNEEKYGKEKWAEMEYARTEAEFNSGKWHRHVVYDIKDYDEKKNKAKAVFIQNEKRVI